MIDVRLTLVGIAMLLMLVGVAVFAAKGGRPVAPGIAGSLEDCHDHRLGVVDRRDGAGRVCAAAVPHIIEPCD